MTDTLRPMRLTPELVARVHRHIEPPGPPKGLTLTPEEDHIAATRELLAGVPRDEVWIFAYGSLIWKPGCEVAERRTGILKGWRRSFCLGWDRRFRGNPEQPGVMLALDRGGQCAGVAQRLPAENVEANLTMLLRRENVLKPSPIPPRWVNLATAEGPVRALAFIVDRKHPAYIGGLSAEQIADALATAVGPLGSMAEYLHSTVAHLEAAGIRDRFLWRMQEMVAERIEAAAGQGSA